MGEQLKTNVELEQEVLALKRRAKILLMEGRVPRKKRAQVWVIILLMSGIWAGAYLEYGHTAQWPVVWKRGLLGACALAALLLVSYVNSRRKKREAGRWCQQLDAVVDMNDFQDRDCLYDFLKPDQRLQLIRTLQQMPEGSRSLRKAVKIVSPVLIDDAI